MKNIVFLFTCICLFGCENSPYPGFSVTKSGIHYKFHTVGDEKDGYEKGDWITLNLTLVENQKDTLVQEKIYQKYLPSPDSGWTELLGMLVVGDSVSAYLTGHQIDSDVDLIQTQVYQVHVGIESAMDNVSFQFFKKYPELAYDPELDEQVNLIHLISEYPSESIQYGGGVFLITNEEGKGDVPNRGDEVICHYELRNLNGKLLDSTYERKSPFSYVIGTQGQVLDGFNIGVRKMRLGQKATLIVPSNLAFGSRGSSTQIAKEYETLIFEIDMLDILRSETLE